MALREAWWFHTVSETLQDAIKPLRERGVFREDCLSALCEFRSDTPFTGRLAAGLGDGVGPPGRVNIIVAITSGLYGLPLESAKSFFGAALLWHRLNCPGKASAESLPLSN